MLTKMRPMLGITRDGKKKPALDKFYDFSKGRTDINKKCLFIRSRLRAENGKWLPFILLWIVNAQTMLCLKERKDGRKTKSFDIGFDLAMSLVVPEIRRRPKVG